MKTPKPKLKLFTAKPGKNRTATKVRSDLDAQADASKPGHNIGIATKQPGDRI